MTNTIKLIPMKTKSSSGFQSPEYVSPVAYLHGFVTEGVLCASDDEDYTDNGGALYDNDWGEF